jgi:hypothetical protein
MACEKFFEKGKSTGTDSDKFAIQIVNYYFSIGLALRSKNLSFAFSVYEE